MKLNKVTIKNRYPLPRIDDLFDRLKGETMFSRIDLRYRYHQVCIKEEDIYKTMFKSRNEEKHKNNLLVVMILLRDHHLYVKLSKCSLIYTKMHYLVHVLSREGITIVPQKIRAILEWENIKNVDEVTSFMGSVGYYRRFIRNFSHISYPMTSLHTKGKKLEWTKEWATSFDNLKQLLTNARILKIADLDQVFVVCTNACKRGLGVVIM
eukprot:PITA_36393